MILCIRDNALITSSLVSFSHIVTTRPQRTRLNIIISMSIERVDHNKANQLLNIGRLVDVQWKLGFAMSSNDCRNLNSPYITMVMKVIESSGSICSKSFEMSISEFKTFSNQVKDIANTLETV